jgi:hypothetical protein
MYLELETSASRAPVPSPFPCLEPVPRLLPLPSRSIVLPFYLPRARDTYGLEPVRVHVRVRVWCVMVVPVCHRRCGSRSLHVA